MVFLTLQLLLTCFAAPGAPQGALVGGSPPEQPGPALGYRFRLPPGEQLLSYAWDRGPEIPYLVPDADVQLEYGEEGASWKTLLYLPMNSWIEPWLSGSQVSDFQNIGRTAGYIGEALALADDTSARLQLRSFPADSLGWTVSCWIRPEPQALGRTLFLFTRALRIHLLPDGRMGAQLLDPTSPSLASPSPVRLGVWNHFAASYDAAQLGQLRIVLNGEPANLTLPFGAPRRDPTELVLGDVAMSAHGFRGVLDDLRIEARPASCAQMIEDGVRRPAAGPHSLLLHTTSDTHSVELWADPATDPVIDTDAEFARGFLEGAVVESNSLRWAAGRWRRLETADAPAARTTHPTVSLGDREVFLFGGETRDSHLWPHVNTNDTWILDTGRRTWTRVSGSPEPPPRCHVPAAYSPDHDLVLLVGGWRNDYAPGHILGDTWAFRVAERRWEQRAPMISATSDHVLVYHPVAQRFLLLRGRQALLYDPVLDRWTLLPQVQVVDESGRPSAYTVKASVASGFYPPTGQVVLYGGASCSGSSCTYSGETALYDLGTNTITVLAPPLSPTPRARSGFAYDSRRARFVLFGGTLDQRSRRFNDLWTFDPQTRRWTEHQASATPSVRGGYYGMAYDELSDRFVLACGRESYDRVLDETWMLELDEALHGGALYVFDRAALSPAWRWFANVQTPGNSGATFYFRSSGSGVRWGPWHRSPAGLGHARFVEVAVLLQRGSNGEVPSVQALGFR